MTSDRSCWLAEACRISFAFSFWHLPVALYMQAQDAQVMCHWVLHLLQTYSSHNKGRLNVQTAASLRQDAVGESYR